MVSESGAVLYTHTHTHTLDFMTPHVSPSLQILLDMMDLILFRFLLFGQYLSVWLKDIFDRHYRVNVL